MYYPYLRGKQFELLALRELANELAGDFRFVPIVEPVKMTFTGLTTAVSTMINKNLKFALVLNPNEGDFQFEKKDLLHEIAPLKDHRDAWLPAFIYQDSENENIEQIIDRYELEHVMLVFGDYSIQERNLNVFHLLEKTQVEYVVVSEGDSRTLMRRLFHQYPDKKFIRLDDNFNEAKRNADYGQHTDERFTEEHLYYEDDHFYGFGDYTALNKHFAEGGMLPYAIAIHLTYQQEDRVVYIHHFVSDTNDDRSNIQGKFIEAARKVELFYRDHEKTPAVEEILHLIEEGRYPGLGFLKKLSIKNSIQLMNRILKSSNL